MKRSFATAVVLAGILTAGGCAAEAEQAAKARVEQAPTAIPSPTMSSLQNASLPLDRYTTTIDEWVELDYASKLLAFDCLKRFGHDLDPGGRLELTSFRDRTNRLGLVDAELAARSGYHADPRNGGQSPRDNGPKLTDEQGKIMFGDPSRPDVPERGCTGEGYRKIGWNIDDDVWLQELDNDAAQRTLADKRARQVTARWSACMRESGYRYDEPRAASQDPRWWKGADNTPATKAEMNTAVADVRCKAKVNYLGEMSAILTAYQQQTVETNLERLEAVHRQVQQALKKAAAVLSGR